MYLGREMNDDGTSRGCWDRLGLCCVCTVCGRTVEEERNLYCTAYG